MIPLVAKMWPRMLPGHSLQTPPDNPSGPYRIRFWRVFWQDISSYWTELKIVAFLTSAFIGGIWGWRGLTAASALFMAVRSVIVLLCLVGAMALYIILWHAPALVDAENQARIDALISENASLKTVSPRLHEQRRTVRKLLKEFDVEGLKIIQFILYHGPLGLGLLTANAKELNQQKLMPTINYAQQLGLVEITRGPMEFQVKPELAEATDAEITLILTGTVHQSYE